MINNVLSSIYSRSTLFNPRQKKKLSRGGVVFEKLYLSSKPRVVFLLKDPGVSGGWSWPEEMRKQIRNVKTKDSFSLGWHKTARQLGIWSYGICNDFPDYDKIENNTNSAEGLKYVGMSNLKKTPGTSNVSTMSQVEQEARRTSKLLKQELDIMAPDIIICCGRNCMGDLVTNVLGFPNTKLHIQASGQKFQYSVIQTKRRNVIIIDFYHPANQDKKQALMYQDLKKVFNGLKRRSLI